MGAFARAIVGAIVLGGLVGCAPTERSRVIVHGRFAEGRITVTTIEVAQSALP